MLGNRQFPDGGAARAFAELDAVTALIGQRADLVIVIGALARVGDDFSAYPAA
jgi:hypothetical protein